MKKVRQFALLVMVFLLFAATLTTPASASEIDSSQIQKFEDGTYIVVTIEYDQSQNSIFSLASRSVTSGTKKYTSYDSSDKALWEFRVHGTFTYNGVTASATGASYSYDIYDSNWSFVEGNATYSGTTATATGTFKWLLFPNTVTLSLTCSPQGVLS